MTLDDIIHDDHNPLMKPDGIITSDRDTSAQATHLQLCQFIGQDLAALELCFENQKDFNDYTTCVICTLCIIDSK